MCCSYLIDLDDASTSLWRGQLSEVGRHDNRGCSNACPYDQAADDEAPAKASRVMFDLKLSWQTIQSNSACAVVHQFVQVSTSVLDQC